jgi:hypothetical protein
MKERGRVAGIDNAPVYSDCLFIDFDSRSGVLEMERYLRSTGIGYSRWATGRRGAHLHIDIEPMRGVHVPQSQLEWVRTRFDGHIDGIVDDTTFRKTSIIRLPGTWHEKNPGRRKERLYNVVGNRLVIPALSEPPVGSIKKKDIPDTKGAADFWLAMITRKGEPGRNQRVYSLGCLARECGLSHEKGLEAVIHWAATKCDPPLTHVGEIRRQYGNGYRSFVAQGQEAKD